MIPPEVQDQRAWARDTISSVDWLVPFPEAAVGELEEAVRRLRRDPLPLLLLSPAHFSLGTCADVMVTVSRKLRQGVGLAVIDRIPVEHFSADENRAIYWLLGCLLGRPVAQKWDGTMIYDVRDTGKALEYGVRRSVTNLELLFHTDAPWLSLPPELVGLLCLSPAREGGVSRFLSLVTVHNELKRRRPDLLPRLYRPFPWDRQAEHAPHDDRVAWQPVFHLDRGDLVARYNDALIASAEGLSGTPLDTEGREALAAMRAIADSPELWVEFPIEKGQIQYLNNRHFAHSRTAFQDAPEPHLRRHLIRLWNRDEGRQTFHGCG
jgi:alpha-ketoglutarate-dependent taurine dioxygenase